MLGGHSGGGWACGGTGCTHEVSLQNVVDSRNFYWTSAVGCCGGWVGRKEGELPLGTSQGFDTTLAGAAFCHWIRRRAYVWDRSRPTPLVTPQGTIAFDSWKELPVYCALQLSLADLPRRKEGVVQGWRLLCSRAEQLAPLRVPVELCIGISASTWPNISGSSPANRGRVEMREWIGSNGGLLSRDCRARQHRTPNGRNILNAKRATKSGSTSQR